MDMNNTTLSKIDAEMNTGNNTDPCGGENCTDAATVLVESSQRGSRAAHMCRACARAALRVDPSLCTYGLI